MFQLLLYISANVRETGRANVFDAYSDRLGSEEALVKRISFWANSVCFRSGIGLGYIIFVSF